MAPNLPTGQGVQVLEPFALLNDPAAHADPAAVADPPPHPKPTRALQMPLQFALLSPAVSPYLPTGHCEHTPSPSAAYVPGMHSVCSTGSRTMHHAHCSGSYAV